MALLHIPMGNPGAISRRWSCAVRSVRCLVCRCNDVRLDGSLDLGRCCLGQQILGAKEDEMSKSDSQLIAMSPGFRELVAVLKRCSDATVGGCEGCNVFEACVRWWDTQGVSGQKGLIGKWRGNIRAKKWGPRADVSMPAWE